MTWESFLDRAAEIQVVHLVTLIKVSKTAIIVIMDMVMAILLTLHFKLKLSNNNNRRRKRRCKIRAQGKKEESSITSLGILY